MIASEVSVRDLMTDKVVKANSKHSFTELCRLLFQLKIHHLPVVDENDELAGIISSNDILKAYGTRVSNYKNIDDEWLNNNITIYDLMTPNPIVIGPDASVEEAIQLLKNERIQSLPVVEGKKVVGILTTRDIIEHLVE